MSSCDLRTGWGLQWIYVMYRVGFLGDTFMYRVGFLGGTAMYSVGFMGVLLCTGSVTLCIGQ